MAMYPLPHILQFCLAPNPPIPLTLQLFLRAGTHWHTATLCPRQPRRVSVGRRATCPNMRARGEGAARAAIRGELTLTAPAASKRVVAATGSPRLLGGRGRGRCSLQPRAAGALCPLRRRAAGRRRRHSRAPPQCPPAPATRATQIAQQPHRAATRHFSVAGPTWLATILPRASRRARPLPSTRMADALEHQHRTAWLIFYFSPSIFLCVSTASWSGL